MHCCSALLLIAFAAAAATAFAVVPRPEHPRPYFERSSWLSVNGEWEFETAAL